jgi:predicted ATPase/class 3 adenylate cyclase
MAAPSGTVTFLFTDVEGSTRLWDIAPDAMRTALELHDAIVRGAIARHGGVVFSTGGDGFAAAFARAGDAFAAATDAQTQLASAPWPAEAEVRVRMGLHTGEVIEREGDYFGTPVNQAARLMALGHGGQVLCSAVTAGLLGSDAALVDLGEYRLRDVSALQRVFQVGPGAFRALRALEELPGNLRAPPTSFVGRAAELAEVVALVRAHRLVTLTGVGGVGKTRLAVEAASVMAGEFPDGVWVVELGPVDDPAEVPDAAATTLGLIEQRGVNATESVTAALAGRRCLVVVDNCEHVLDAAADLIDAILARSPTPKVLATSREGVRAAHEQLWPVPSLDVRRGIESEAVALFVERARAVVPAFEMRAAEERASVVEVCQRLDGIPLAIELAAARVIAFTPAEIAAHLDERFRLLTGGRRAALERHHTLRAALDWSYSLLGEPERAVFDRLAVFPASFDAAAATAVATGDGIEDWDVIDALTGLVAKSMLDAGPGAAGSTRYEMLETVRHYAREQLAAAGSADERRRRHARHFASVAEQIGPRWEDFEEEDPWLAKVLADLDNFRAAVAWGLDAASDEDAELAMRIIAYVAASVTEGYTGGVGAWAEQAVERAGASDPRYRGVVYALAAVAALNRGDYALGRRLGAEALRHGAVEGCPYPSIPYLAAFMYARPDDLPVLLADGLAALERADASESDRAFLRAGVAAMAALHGRLEMAESEAASALAAGRRLNSGRVMTNALYTIGLARSHSDPDAALAALDEYLAIAGTRHTSEVVLARSLALRAQLRATAGDLPGALDDLHRALDTAVVKGDRPAMAFTLARAVFVLCSEDPVTAAILSGLTGGGVLARQLPVLTWEREWFQQTVDRIKDRLGDEPYRTAFSRGTALTHDDAVATALGAIERLSRR